MNRTIRKIVNDRQYSREIIDVIELAYNEGNEDNYNHGYSDGFTEGKQETEYGLKFNMMANILEINNNLLLLLSKNNEQRSTST